MVATILPHNYWDIRNFYFTNASGKRRWKQMGKKPITRSIKVEEKYVKFYKMFHKKCKNDQDLILCLNTLSDCGVEGDSDLRWKNTLGDVIVEK